MTDAYFQILQTARTTVIWEMILLSFLFLLITAAVFLIPYEYKTKSGLVRSTFLRMTSKWQLWVFKGCFAALLIGMCLWINVSEVGQIRKIEQDMAESSFVTVTSEYAVEKPIFSLSSRHTIWISDRDEERSLTQYGSDLSSGDVGIATIVYGEHSRIVLNLSQNTNQN